MVSNTHSDTHVKPKTPSLSLDHLGGASYTAARSRKLRLKQRRLRFLHLENCPALRSLDLSGCHPELHLTVVACPELRYIRLAEGGEGAVIHLDAGERPPQLTVDGAIRQLDACWQGGQFAAEAHHARPPLRHAAIGCRPADGVARELLVLVGDRVPAAVLQLHERGLRQLIVREVPARRLELWGRLESVQISDCAALTSVVGADALRRLQLSDCPRLDQVAAHGRNLTLRRAGDQTLTVDGHWHQLQIADSALVRLDAPHTQALRLRDCPRLTHGRLAPRAEVSLSGDCRLVLTDTARLHLDERAVAGLLERLAEGERGAQRMLYEWCGQPLRPREVLDALQALARAAEHGDPQGLWLLRCRLHAANDCNTSELDDARCLRYARAIWRWRLPRDLYQEGWNADLRLWRACREQLETRGTERVLARGRQLPAQVALMQLLLDAPAPDPRLRHLLLRALRRRNVPYPGGHEVPEHPHQCLERLLQGVIALRDSALAGALVGRITGLLNPIAQLSLLGALSAYGQSSARAQLMSIAQHLGRDHPELRGRAMGLALAPVRQPLFQQQQEEDMYAS